VLFGALGSQAEEAACEQRLVEIDASIARLAQEQRKAEEAEAARLAEEHKAKTARQVEEQRKAQEAEAARRAEVQRRAEEAAKLTEEKRRAEETAAQGGAEHEPQASHEIQNSQARATASRKVQEQDQDEKVPAFSRNFGYICTTFVTLIAIIGAVSDRGRSHQIFTSDLFIVILVPLFGLPAAFISKMYLTATARSGSLFIFAGVMCGIGSFLISLLIAFH
jgi:hypothetical protein